MTRRRTLVVLLVAAALVLLAGAGVGWLVLRAPQPLAGDHSFDAVVDCPSCEHVEADLGVLKQRFDAAGLRMDSAPAGDGRIVAHVRGAASEHAVRSLLVPGRIAMRLESELQPEIDVSGESLPQGVERRSEMVGHTVRSVWSGPNRVSLLPVMKHAPAGPYLMLVQCSRVEAGAAGPRTAGARCKLRFLEREIIVENRHIVGTRVVTSDVSPPALAIELDGAGKQRLAEATTRAVGRRLAIVWDGRIEALPVIATPLTGGTAQILLGASSDYDTSLQTAHALAVVLAHEPIDRAWRTVSVLAK